ncbi:rho family-interacting cell polarization regulator 2-like isoform X3 [Portunus trituberculatus]|uniref:rho family-interacting cell polarization regulator 2-like isoform X3 n=1 Tax=Portunus trituberculatus TaxID=210409 RepID=UPI001E1CBED2|nr:rho family-interacting cell polarization regulator 2-like isoform X3 [Portunus trituberculatus]
MRSQHGTGESQVRLGVELWEVGEPLAPGEADPGGGEGVGGGLNPPGPSQGGTGVPGTTRSNSSRSDTSSSEASSSSSGSSSGALRRPCLLTALSDPGYESAHPPDDEREDAERRRRRECCQGGEDMSLRERCEGREGSPLHQGLTRSRSFGGLLTHRRSGSGAGSPQQAAARAGWAGQGVLGQTGSSPRDVRRVLALPPHVKVPKSPRPERASQISSSVAHGLKDCVGVTKQDLEALHQVSQDAHLHQQSQGRLYEVEKQIKAAERYLKRVEYHLSKLEDLQDQYTLHQKLRDGVRSMAYAYALSPGKEKASALSNVRSGYRECTETLCALEVKIEQLIGTLTLEMKGIQGFARLCPGDVFEVTLKHGTQKWKSRGRVCKDNTQTWDNQRTVIKGLIGEMLLIKAVEVRVLGKTVVIGNKVCETKDLFSPHPQLMTVNLNPSGSLKLNLVITWNPLDGVIEDGLMRTPSMSATSPGNKRRLPVLHPLSSSPPNTVAGVPSGKDSNLSPECDHDSSFGSMSARSSTADSASPLSEYRGLLSSHAALSTRTDSNSPVSDYQGLSRRSDSQDSILFDGRDSASPQCDNTGNFTLVRKKESRVEQWARYSQFSISQGSNMDMMSRSFSHLSSYSTGLSPTMSQSLSQQLDLLATEPESFKWGEGHTWDEANPPMTLKKVVSRLRTCLEDIQGQFPQLHTLEEAVLDLDDMCRTCSSRRGSSASDISLLVESALECFDFLSAECDDIDDDDDHGDDDDEYYPENCRSRRDSNTSEISLSVESALECFDFLNAVCDDDFEDDHPDACEEKKNKETAALLAASCQPDTSQPVVTSSAQLDLFLYTHLRHALQLLQHLGSFGPLRSREHHSLKKLEEEGRLVAGVLAHRHNFDSLKPQHLITVPHVQVLWDSVAGGDDWCVTGQAVVSGLLQVVSSLVDPTVPNLARRVLEEMVCVMTDAEEFEGKALVTVGHFLHHLHRPLEQTVPLIGQSLTTAELLLSGNLKKVEAGLHQIKEPTALHIKIIGHLLAGPSELRHVTTTFVNSLAHNNQLMQVIVELCLLLLESGRTSNREAACVLLGVLAPVVPENTDRKGEGKKAGKSSNKTKKHSPAQQKEVPEWPRPIEVLSFLQQNDPSGEVREAARQALLSLGTEGQSALQQVQLSSHGFQGVDMKEKAKVAGKEG